jgi:hypothetical protein
MGIKSGAETVAVTEWTKFETIDAVELAKRLSVPKSWVDEKVRTRTKEKIPHLKLGKYVRFAWGSPELADWLRQRMVVSNSTVDEPRRNLR